MKFSPARRLRSSLPLLTLMALAPLALLSNGCSQSASTSTAPAVAPAQDLAAKIKAVEADARMPADVKAKEIERLKAEAQTRP